MKNILLIVMVVSLFGCKTKKSHVEKHSLDSLIQNQVKSNVNLQSTVNTELNNSLKIDSTWKVGLQLKNFSGTIFSNGNFQGTADEVNQLSEGNTKKENNQNKKNKTSETAVVAAVSDSKVRIKKTETVADKETKGISVPWYYGFAGLVGLALLIYFLYNRVKSKINF